MRNREIYIQCNNNKCGVWICAIIRWSVVIAGGMIIKSKKQQFLSWGSLPHSLEVGTKSISQVDSFSYFN